MSVVADESLIERTLLSLQEKVQKGREFDIILTVTTLISSATTMEAVASSLLPKVSLTYH